MPEQLPQSVPAATGCRVIAVLESGYHEEIDALSRLLQDVIATGADGVELVARGGPESEGTRDRMRQFIERAGSVQRVVAPHHVSVVEQLSPLPFEAWKIDPPLLTHLPLLESVAADGRPIFLGVGGCTLRELEEALCRLPADVVILHTLGMAGGLADVADVAYLSALRRYGRTVGYADRSTDTGPALIAVALGAAVVEKPLTFERLVRTPGHRSSLLPHEFLAFVRHVRRIEQVLAGDGARDPLPDELDAIERERVSIVAARRISRGTPIQRDMLTLRAPGVGLPPRFLGFLEGRRASYDIPEGAFLTFGLID